MSVWLDTQKGMYIIIIIIITIIITKVSDIALNSTMATQSTFTESLTSSRN